MSWIIYWCYNHDRRKKIFPICPLGMVLQFSCYKGQSIGSFSLTYKQGWGLDHQWNISCIPLRTPTDALNSITDALNSICIQLSRKWNLGVKSIKVELNYNCNISRGERRQWNHQMVCQLHVHGRANTAQYHYFLQHVSFPLCRKSR